MGALENKINWWKEITVRKFEIMSETRPNQKCFCGTDLKFKKCCYEIFVGWKKKYKQT